MYVYYSCSSKPSVSLFLSLMFKSIHAQGTENSTAAVDLTGKKKK